MLFRVSDAWKSYGGNAVLRGASFQVNPGEKIGLVGRNGAGKSTLFRLITGAELPDKGEVARINGLNIGLLDQHVDFALGDTVHTAALSAFREIHDIEAEMRLLEKRMETDHSPETLEKYAELQSAFEHADGFTYTARAEAVLLGIGFSRDVWMQDAATLSGGQKNRLGMARLLLSAADLLLLDEPTNHLDVDAVEWLEEFLRNIGKAYIVISHDRYFLDNIAARIIEVENGKTIDYKGNYSKYVVERAFRRQQQQRAYENQKAFISKTNEFIRRNLEGQKTKQAKSRRNMLERIERIDAVASETVGGQFGLKQVERAGNNVLTIEDVAIGYDQRAIVSGINLSLHRGEALGIIGPNGSGKTTFLKTIMGGLREISGQILWGTKINIGYYSQNLEGLEPRNEVIAELRRVAPMAENGELRSFLARFLFFGDDVFKRVADLSGGEKGRLALAKLIYSRKNVLILDEPTNHLDIPAREALEAALDEYDGTIIAVSHDRFFLDRISTQIMAFSSEGADVFNGKYTEYHHWKERIRQDSPEKFAEPSPLTNLEPETITAEHKNRSKPKSSLSKNQRASLEKRIAAIQKEIPALESEAAQITSKMSRPEIAADYDKFTEMTQKLNEIEERVRRLYEEWESAETQLD